MRPVYVSLTSSINPGRLVPVRMMDNLIPQVSNAVLKLEDCLGSYSRVRILTTTLIGTYFATILYEAYQDGDFSWANVKARAFRLFIKLPIVRGIAAKEIGDADKSVSDHCRSIFKGVKFLETLPLKGMTKAEIMEEFAKYQTISTVKWREGRASGTVYSDLSTDLAEIVKEVYSATSHTNPLHPEVFTGINKMEAEIVRMVANLYRGDEKVCGTLTSGGTESLILSVKAYREYARAERGITRPELVVPVTAHAAFQKACQYFRIRLRTIPVDPVTYKVDLNAMRRAISSNTIALVGSACGYPHGIIDDIESISDLGVKYGIPVHVDCCLGGFIVPFVREAGFDLPDVDFTLPGVTSISVDTHKYGYAPKGSSVILYRNKNIRKNQFSVQTDWPGGIYASPTISGSRAGSAIATCWASLMYYGLQGYIDATRKIINAQRKILAALKQEKNIFIMGEPILSVIGVGSNVFNIFRLSELLSERGWQMNPLQFPSGFHICVTLMHVQEGVVEALIKDMKECIAICSSEPSKPADGLGIVYGMAQTIPDRSIVSDIACQFLDGILDSK